MWGRGLLWSVQKCEKWWRLGLKKLWLWWEARGEAGRFSWVKVSRTCGLTGCEGNGRKSRDKNGQILVLMTDLWTVGHKPDWGKDNGLEVLLKYILRKLSRRPWDMQVEVREDVLVGKRDLRIIKVLASYPCMGSNGLESSTYKINQIKRSLWRI